MMMKFRSRLLRLRIHTTITLGIILVFAGTSHAADRFVFGSIGIKNPSNSNDPASFERLGHVSAMITADGTATNMTSVGRGFTIPAHAVDQSGFRLLSFPGFAIVAQGSFSHSSPQPFAERFSVGNGAAAGGDINFCPPQGTPDPLQGNLNCLAFSNPGAGNYTVRLGISPSPGGNAFGGTLRLMRILTNATEYYALPPFIPLGNTTQIAVISAQPNTMSTLWMPGQPNYAFASEPNPKGPVFNAYLTTMGKIASFTTPTGMANPTPTPDNADLGWGFEMTTGMISGSDIYPPGSVTPFFFFQTTGSDTVTPSGEIRNIVLLGGSIAKNGKFGSLYNRIMVFDVAVPEPGTMVGLAGGFVGLMALTVIRRRI